MLRHRQRHWRRPLLSVLTAALALGAGVTVLAAPAQAAVTDLRINEVEAGGSPDWVELVNTGSTAQALTGLVLRDDSDATDHTWVIPAGLTVPAGGRLTIDQSDAGVTGFPFGLGNGGDKVRLFQSDGTTAVDSKNATYNP